jgi:capsular exopolysaccharide synthesis family protein
MNSSPKSVAPLGYSSRADAIPSGRLGAGTTNESESMGLRDYALLLRRRWRLIVFIMLLGLAAATAATAAQHKVYTARVQFFVSAQDRANAGDISSAYSGGLFSQQRVKTYVSLVNSLRTADLVKSDSNLELSSDAIASKLSASAPLDQILINVAVTDGNPALAQRIADSLGKVFPTIVDELERPASGGPSPVKVSLVHSPSLPRYPTSPRPKLNLALGLLLGLALGVGGGVLFDTLDTTVKGLEQARAILGAPVLGAIAFDPEASSRPLVVLDSPMSLRSEAFRQLRTNLQFVDIGHPLQSVVITSSVPGEGKSTTTCNLAVALAQSGLRVVVVEGDLRRPRVADYFGLEGAIGLTSVLLGEISLDDALQTWGDVSLRVLASGPLPPNPSELLGSSYMQQLLDNLEAQSDMVLIDAPPLLPVTDAAVLGVLTSGVIIIIRSGDTRRDQLLQAALTVEQVGATILGSVVNMVPTQGPDSYGYNYDYNYAARRQQ